MNSLIKNNDGLRNHKSWSKNKFNPAIEKVKFKCSKFRSFEKLELLNLISEFYQLKIDSDLKRDSEKLPRLEFDVVIFDHISKSNSFLKARDEKCERIVITCLKYCDRDSRIELFSSFLGINGVKLRREVLDYFLLVLKSVPVQFYKIFQHEDENYQLMKTETCFEIYNPILEPFKLSKINFFQIINSSFMDNEESISKNINHKQLKIDTFLINRFTTNSISFVSKLSEEFKNNIDAKINIELLYQYFFTSNKEFEIKYYSFKSLMNRNFSVCNDFMSLESFFTFISNITDSYKIEISQFIQISITSFIIIIQQIELRLGKLFDDFDVEKEGRFHLKEFKFALSELLHTNDRNWELNDHFIKALNNQNKDFLNKDEFIKYGLNQEFILRPILIEYSESLNSQEI